MWNNKEIHGIVKTGHGQKLNIKHSSDITWRVIMNEALLEFNGIIDEEIHAYENLGELYETKKQALIDWKSDDLSRIDAQITEKAETIKDLSTKRKELAKNMGNENFTFSEIIEKTEAINKNLAKKFKDQQKKLKELSLSLTLEEKTCLELIKHGLKIVEKKVEIICDVVSPQTEQYDKSGHSIKSNESIVSSITEDV